MNEIEIIGMLKLSDDPVALEGPQWTSVGEKSIEQFRSRLADWYPREGRSFPWRHTSNPFHVLVAEIMLRLTGAWKVVRVYPTFIVRFGTPQAIVDAGIQELEVFFLQLGLHKRASLLKAISSSLMDRFNGAVPDTYEQLITLVGVGRYTANAVLCLAYHERAPLVDNSTMRILGRCFGYASDRPAYADQELWALADRLLPVHGYREHNLALLDLGAVVCRHPRPLCLDCPLVDTCSYSQAESQSKGGLHAHH